jgi:short-subunit dehydrogenase
MGRRRPALTGFENQVVFITGASSGIGAALAREFGRRGASLALAARRLNRLETLAQEVERDGHRAMALACDVTRDEDLERAATAVRAALGRIDVVVANAGFGVVGAVADLSLADYRRQFETNVFGVLRTVYATLPDLERSRGRLVVIGSVSGHVAVPGNSAYAMSKFAVRALADALGHELRSRGVAVTLVSPGYVESEIYRVDNLGVLHPDGPDPVPRFLRMSADDAARQIAAAVARRRPEVVITVHGKIAVFLQRHLPGLVRWGIGRFAVRSRREPRTTA